MFKFEKNNKEYICDQAQINVNEVAFVCTPTKTVKNKETFQNNRFQPNNIRGLQVWLDASDKDSLVLNGQSVVTWKDKSGLGYNATGVENPKYYGDDIIFNGQGQHFTTKYTAKSPAESVFIVYTNKHPAQASLVESDAPGGRQFMNNGGGGVGPSLANNNIVWLALGKIPTELGIKYLGESIYNSSGINLYLNGKLSVSNQTNPNYNGGLTTIGGSPGQRNYYLNGSISEVVIYDSVLSTSDRQNVENYLASKWGLYKVEPIATFFTDCNYSGQSSSLGVGRYDLPQMGIPNDSLSSVRVPSGLKVTIFEHGGFQGRSLELTADEACLVNVNKDGLNFNDQTSGIIIERIDIPYSYLPLIQGANDIGSNPQQSAVRGETKFGIVGGKKAAIFNNRMDTFVQLNNKTNNVFTVMFWIYTTDVGYYTAVSITDGNNPVLQFDVRESQLIAYSALPNPWVHDNWSRASVPAGTWYHVAYVCKNNEAVVYINGKKDSAFKGSGVMNSASRPFWFIGRSGDAGRAFNGAIRHFAVWNNVVDENIINNFMRQTENDNNKGGIVKYVRLEGGNEDINLSQLVVTDVNGENIAKGRKATSSGYCCDAPESNAVDGVEASRGHPGEYHSNGGGKGAWFQVELSEPSQIFSVTVYNRADCCQGRMASGYRIKLLDSQGNVVFTSQPLTAEAKQVIQIIGPATKERETQLFKKLNCNNGEIQAGFSCYPSWLANASYTFTQGLDSGGNDIGRSGNADNAAALKKDCDADPNCVGFNTNGYLKNKINPVNTWSKWTDDPNKGFYAKNK